MSTRVTTLCLALSILMVGMSALMGQTGHEWMQSAPPFCQSERYGSLTARQKSICDEAAFRYLSKNWQTITAANGQAYEIALDTVHRNLPNNIDSGASLRAAAVTVYISEGEIFNPENVVRFYFDCHDHFQTFQRRWSPITYAPPLSVAAKIASIACVEAREKQSLAAAPAPIRQDDYDPIPAAWSIKIGLPGTLSVGASYCTQSGACQIVGNDLQGLAIGRTPVGGVQFCQSSPEAEPCRNARIPVDVLAASPVGSVIVRLKGRNYAVGGVQWYKREPDGSFIGGPVSVLYQGVSTPLQCAEPFRRYFLSGCGK